MAKIDDVKKDAKLFGMLLTFSMKKDFTSENILFTYDKGNMAGIYPKYIKPGSPKEINIDGKLREAMTKAYNEGNEQNFKILLKKAKEVTTGLCNQIVDRFMATDEYKLYVAKAEVTKSAAKAMKVLGISTKGKEQLIEGMAYAKIKNKKEAEKAFTALAKTEKMKEKADAIMKSLKSSGLI